MLATTLQTTANYADSTVDPDREVIFYLGIPGPVFAQFARINPKDGSRLWDTQDVPLPACDIAVKAGGVRFKSNGASVDVAVLWVYEKDDVEVLSFSSNT